MEDIFGVVLPFDFLEEIEIAKVGALRVGKITIRVVAVVTFDAALC